MTSRLRDLAARGARGFAKIVRPEITEGAGNAGCALHRRSRVQNCKKNAHEHTGSAEAIRHSPRNVLRLTSRSPGNQACLTPSPALLLADLTPASGRQNDTTWPYASAPFVKGTNCVHRIPPHVDDVGQRPSQGTGQ